MSLFDHIADFLANSHEIIPGTLWQTSWLGEFKDVPEDRRPYVISLVDTPDGGGLSGFLRWPFDDKPELPDMSIAWPVARVGSAWTCRGPVIVHCLEGNNRSGLICGMLLSNGIQINGEPVKFSGLAAVQQIRMANPHALYNETFRQFLESIPGCWEAA